MTITWLVDVSNWQDDIDIAQIAREDYKACVCKATEGSTWKDPWFDRYIPQVQKAGMIPGAYHYLRGGDGAAQARALHARVAEHGGPTGWLIQLDCEADGYGNEMTEWAREWNALTDSHPFLIYSGAWWWPRTHDFRGRDLTPYLWHSHYVSGSGYGSVLYRQVPDSWWRPGYGGWDEATILQFSSHGQVAGTRVDVNAFRGTVEQLRKLTTTPRTSTPRLSTRPAPGPAIPFPLPAGYYFGPKDGPDESVSGFYGRRFNGRTDREWLEIWAHQLARRGWPIGKGRRYLTRYGNDGRYGPEYRRLALAFQHDQHLVQDGLIGVRTWTAAFHNPVT